MRHTTPLRLFFALWPDEALRQALAGWLKPLIPADIGRPVPAQNLHVTLAFLGNVEPERVAVLESLAGTLEWPAVDVVFDRTAYWPKARLLCLEAATPPDALLAAVARLHESLREAGFEIERRPFRAHITLVRNLPGPPEPGEGLQGVPEFVWPVRGVALVASTSAPGGSQYRVLRQW
jgi:RNA 2',3'-cyclic 3'-phosphodiesterase